MKRYIATLASLALVFGLGACLMSLTESFEYDVLNEPVPPLPEIDLTGRDGHLEPIDFTTDSVFEDNKDDIKNVDRVEFHVGMFTKNGDAAELDISFRKPAEGTSPPGDWVPILKRVPVPAGTSGTKLHVIEYADSGDYIVKDNFALFQKQATIGKMDLLLEAGELEPGVTNDEVVIKKLVIYVAITAGK